MAASGVILPSECGGKKPDVHSAILSILAQEFPLSAKILHTKVIRQHRLSVSYQAVHKALKSMEEEGLLEKYDRYYRLNIGWINNQHTTFESMKFRYKNRLTDNAGYLNENVQIFRSREDTVRNLISITMRATRGDVIFGHNRSGINYPQGFYAELSKAANRGVKIRCVVPNKIDNIDFVRFLTELGKNVRVRTLDKEYIRLYGIVEKEVMMALPFKNSYLALHFMDRRVANYLYTSFCALWKESKPFVIA